MDKLLNLVSAIQDEFSDYHVSVSAMPGTDYDYMLTSRKIYKKDSNVTHAFNLYELDDFRNEFDKFDVRTGVNEDVADIGAGVNARSGVDAGLAQHWVEFRVKE